MKRRQTTSHIAIYPVLIIMIFLSVGYTRMTQAQNILLNKNQPGFMALAGYGASDKYDGPAAGIGISFNGFTDIGLGLSDLSHNEIRATTWGITPDFLLEKQSTNIPVNVDLSLGFTRTVYNYDYGSYSSISFGMGVSRELMSEPGVHMVPDVYGSYDVILGETETANLITAGLDWNIGIDLSDHILLLFDPGISFAINENSTSGSVAGGLLLK